MSAAGTILGKLISHGFEVFGRYYSSYRGFVVDNQDPEGYGRLKLKVPEVYGQNTMDYWAWQKGTYSGKDYGVQIIPQVKDMVWVEFEKGNPRNPVWTYGHFSKTNTEKEKPDNLKSPDIYWLKTPKGHIIKIDDGNNEINIYHKDKNEVLIKQDELYLNHSSGDYVILNKTGISLKTNSISLGTLDTSKEKAVLGDTLKGSLDDLTQELITLLTTLQTIGSADTANASKYGLTYAATLTSSIPSILIKINLIKAKYQQFLSTKVTLD